MSLKLYYTGAVKFDRPQADPLRSLGSYISSTEIPNGSLGNLYGELSKLTIQNARSEIRVFAIKNTAGVAKTGLKCWFTYPAENDCEFEIGFASPVPDACGDLMTEKIPNIYAIPYTVMMVPDKTSEATALALGTLDAGDYLCIFVRRKVKASAQAPKSETDMLAILEKTLILPTVEDITLSFGWD